MLPNNCLRQQSPVGTGILIERAYGQRADAMTRKLMCKLAVIVLAFISFGLDAQAQISSQQPLALFKTPEQLPRNIQDLHQRAVTSYPDMTRSRIVKVNFDVVEHVFGEPPKSENSFFGATRTQLINVDDGVGVGTPITLNFFDDQTIEVTVDKTAAGAQQITYHHLLLQPKDEPSQHRFLTVTLGEDQAGNEYVTLQYGRAYTGPSYYSLRKLPGTPYHVLIERNRGPDYYHGSIIQPDLSVRKSLPVQLIGGGVGITAEVGPIIDYGLADFSFGDSKVGYAISRSASSGHSPRAFKTVDGGRSWNDLDVEADWVPTSIYFRDRNEDYLTLRFNPVGHSIQNIRGCGLLRTEDGGKHWERLRSTNDDYCLSVMEFESDGTGYAYGWNRKRRTGWLWRSVDDGQSWSAWIELPKSQLGVHRLEFFGDEIVLIPTHGVIDGIMIVGRDGQIREPIRINYPRVRQIRFVSRNVIFANVGDELGNYLLRTLDGGRTWFRVFEGQFALVYVQSADEVGVVLSKGGTSGSDISSPVSAFAYTTDGGQTWIEGPTTNLSPYVLSKFQKLEDGTELMLLGNNLLSVKPDNP